MEHQARSRADLSPVRRDVERVPPAATFADNRPHTAGLRKLAEAMDNSPRVTAQRKFAAAMDNSPRVVAQRKLIDRMAGKPGKRQGGREKEKLLQGQSAPVQRAEGKTDVAPRENNTGLPDRLKSGIEQLSGISLDNVKVHYNSSQPAQLNALAYAQGTDIHVAPGQEQHLPHEAWHVVQQAQGRVSPTLQLKDVAVNDDAGLKHEADTMGRRANMSPLQAGPEGLQRPAAAGRVAQLIEGDELEAALAYFDRRVMETGSTTSKRARALRAQVIATPTGAAANALVDQYVADWNTNIALESAEEVGQPDKVEETDPEAVVEAADQQLKENEAANEESALLHHTLAASILVAAIAWQTYRERTGKEPRGRGAHALDELYTRIDDATNEFRERTQTVDQSKKIYENPFKEGLLAGASVMPMPVAERYAPWQEVLNMLYVVSFLMFAGRKELDDYQKRVKHFALKSKAAEEDPSASSSSGTMDDTMRVRGDLQFGFATGVGATSLGLSYVPQLSSPLMYTQAPWDAFHVLNGLATRAEDARERADLQQRRLIAYNLRILRIYGRRQLSPTFNLAKYSPWVRKLFGK